jgi:hypothetical protein
MIREVEKENSSLYYIFGADWETVIEANNSNQAARAALESSFKKFGKQLNLSPTVMCLSLTGYNKSLDIDSCLEVFFTPELLADIGLHDLSKKFLTILKTMNDPSIDEYEALRDLDQDEE